MWQFEIKRVGIEPLRVRTLWIGDRGAIAMNAGKKFVERLPDRPLRHVEVEAFNRRSTAYVRAQINVITHECYEVHGLLLVTPGRSFGLTYTDPLIATEAEPAGWSLLAEGDDPVQVCHALNTWASDMRARRRAELTPEESVPEGVAP